MRIKRIVALVLFAVITLCFCGCSALNLKTASLQDSIELPENGIISEAFLKQLKEQNGVVTIAGKFEKLRYEWTVFGSDIDTPKDCNMAVELFMQGTDGLSVKFLSKEEFGFSPVLSIYMDEQWDTQSAIVYRVTNGNGEAVCSASVTGSKTSILNFSILTAVGSFAIIPEAAAPTDGKEALNASPSPDLAVSSTPDSYLSKEKQSDGRIYSDGTKTGKDKYKTDPVPEGKPMPVEPDEQNVDEKKSYICSFSIECSTILNNLNVLNREKLDEVPSNGIIFPESTVEFYEGESVYDVLQRVCKENGIHMEASWTPIYNSAYVEGIHNLYEFDCGSGSGWMYRVDGWYPNYGCSRYQLKQGEKVEWRYTCDLGNDVGGGYAIGE